MRIFAEGAEPQKSAFSKKKSNPKFTPKIQTPCNPKVRFSKEFEQWGGAHQAIYCRLLVGSPREKQGCQTQLLIGPFSLPPLHLPVWSSVSTVSETPEGRNKLGPAKTYILRGAPRTYAIKTQAVTDN